MTEEFAFGKFGESVLAGQFFGGVSAFQKFDARLVNRRLQKFAKPKLAPHQLFRTDAIITCNVPKCNL